MKILFLNHNVIWKSTFHRCFQFAKRLVKEGHDITIVTNHPSSRLNFYYEVIDGVKVVKSPDTLWGQLRTGWDPLNALRRVVFLRKEKFDLIHAFDTRPTVIFPALFLKSKLKIPLVIDWSDWWGRGGAIKLREPKWINTLFEPFETWFEEYFRKYADYTIVVSQLLFDRAKKLLNRNSNISIISNGADTSSINPIRSDFARKKLNLSKDFQICIFSGYVIYDIKILISALQLLDKEKFPVIFIFAGSTDNIFYRFGNNLIKKGKLKLVGHLDTQGMNTYLGAADIALLPLSDNLANKARYPMKFGDYLAAGKPVITNDVGIVGKMVKGRKLGRLCRYSDRSFSKEIKSLLADKKELKQFSNNCINVAINEVNYDIRVNSLVKVYKTIGG